MQRQLSAAVACLVFTSQCALARGDYKVNPHAPNGYNASMAGYHYHGTHAPSGEMNGYAASSIRSKHGAQPLLVPNTPSGGGGRFSGGGGGRFSGGGEGRFGESGGGRFGESGGGGGGRFSNRFGGGGEQSSGRFSNRFGGGESDTGRFANRYNGGNYSGARFGATSYGATSYGATAYGAASSGGNDYWAQHFRTRCQPQTSQVPLNNPYAQSYSAQNYTAYSGTNQFISRQSALRSMVNERPVQSMLKNSQGGFNRIYTTE